MHYKEEYFDTEPELVDKTDIPNWKIQAEQWRKTGKNECDIADKVLDYVFLRKQDRNWNSFAASCSKHDTIASTQTFFKAPPHEHRSLKAFQPGKQSLVKKLIPFSRDITADIALNPLDLFDYPVPNELLQLLRKESQRFPSVDVLRQLYKQKDAKLPKPCCGKFNIHHEEYIKRFYDLSKLIQKYRNYVTKASHCTQTDPEKKPEITKDKEIKSPKKEKEICTIEPPSSQLDPCCTAFLKQIRQLEDTAVSPDITLIIENRQFKCHRILLMAFSLWFNNTLSSADYYVTKVQVEGIDPNVFEIIYKWMYTYKLNVELSTLTPVAKAARQLNMPLLIRKIKNLLHNMIMTKGPIAILEAAEKYKSSLLMSSVINAISDDFANTALCQPFMEYSADEILWIFTRKYIVLPKDFDLLSFFIHWLSDKWHERKKDIEKLFCFINYRALSNDEVLATIFTIRDLSITCTPDCRDSILKTFLYYYDQRIQNPCMRYISPCETPRFLCDATAKALSPCPPKQDMDPYLLKEIVKIQCNLHNYDRLIEDVPTENDSKIDKAELICPLDISACKKEDTAATKIQATFRGFKARKKYKLRKAESPKVQHSRKYILLLGGIDPFLKDENEQPGKQVHCYSLDENRWGLLEQMPSSKHHAAAALLHGAIYVAGGSDNFTHNFLQATDSVWCYEFQLHRWSSKRNMNVARMYHSLQSLNGLIFAIGGLDRDKKLLNSIEVYNPATNTWNHVGQLVHARMGASTAVYSETILVCGGIGIDSSTGLSLLLKSCEIFIPDTLKILKMKPLRIPRCFASLVVFNEKLFLVGGATNKDDKTIYSIKDIDVWDENSHSWKEWFPLHIPRQNMITALVGERMFIMGGQASEFSATIKKVECYDHSTKSWIHGITPLPVGVSGPACALIETMSTISLKVISSRLEQW